jgi:multidrug efflux pump subunit AcrB
LKLRSPAPEIYFAVISTTIALAAVFLPIIFLSGLTGRLFREFGITLAGCVLVSAFVALTLSPMMCRFLLKSTATTRTGSTASPSRFSSAWATATAPWLRISCAGAGLAS